MSGGMHHVIVGVHANQLSLRGSNAHGLRSLSLRRCSAVYRGKDPERVEKTMGTSYPWKVRSANELPLLLRCSEQEIQEFHMASFALLPSYQMKK